MYFDLREIHVFVCLSVCLSAKDNIHTDVTCTTEESQQKYRLGTVSNRLLGGGGGLKRVLLDPNPRPQLLQ